MSWWINMHSRINRLLWYILQINNHNWWLVKLLMNGLINWIFIFITLPLKYCNQRLYVFLSICISQKPHVQTFKKFLYMLSVAMAQCFSEDNAICVLHFCFCGLRHIMGQIQIEAWSVQQWIIHCNSPGGAVIVCTWRRSCYGRPPCFFYFAVITLNAG